MSNDFDLMLYEFVKAKPENIKLASQIANRWYNVIQDKFLKSFVENLAENVSTRLPHAKGWEITNEMAGDRYSKYKKFSIYKSSWGRRQVTFSSDATYLASLYYGVSKPKDEQADARFKHLCEKLRGTPNESWEFWLYPESSRGEMQNLSSADGLIRISQGKSANEWADKLVELAEEVDKLFSNGPTLN